MSCCLQRGTKFLSDIHVELRREEATHSSHFSHTPPSLMVAPSREFANIPVSVNKNHCHEQSNQHTNHILTDTYDRPQSACSKSNKTLSVDYATRMEAQNGTWAEQMDIVKEGLSASIHATHPIDPPPFTFVLSHKPSHIYEEPGKVTQPSNENITPPTNHLEENTSTTTSMGSSVIPYSPNTPANLQLWDGNFAATSLFGTEEFLVSNTNNIACSLQCIATFIKQRSLQGKKVDDFPQLKEIGFTAWELISAIYELG